MIRKHGVVVACGVLINLAGCTSETSGQTTYEAQTEISGAARELYSALASGDVDQFNSNSCPDKTLSKTPSTSNFLVKFRDFQLLSAYAVNTNPEASTSQVEVEFRHKGHKDVTKDVHDARRIEGRWKIC